MSGSSGSISSTPQKSPSQPREEVQQEEKTEAGLPVRPAPGSATHAHLPAAVASHLPAQHIITRTIPHIDKTRAIYQPSPTRPSVTGRPIAPAPSTTTVTGIPMSNQVQHTVIPRLPKGVQQVAGAITVAGPSAIASLQTQHQIQAAITPTALQQTVPAAVTPAALAAAHTTMAGALPPAVQASPIVQMASIIRGSSLPQQVITTSMVTVAHSQHTQAGTRSFTTHLPRGVSAAASALPPPKTATAVLRPTPPPGTVHLPTAVAGNMLTASLHQLHRPMTIPAVSAIRPSTPPTTTSSRSTSPHVSSLPVSQATEVHSGMLTFHPSMTAHRPLLGHHPVSSASGSSTVQITIQQPRQQEVTARGPLLSHHTQGTVRPLHTHIPQTLLQPQIQGVQQSQSHKVVISHATVAPIIQPTVTAVSTVAKINKNVATASIISMPTSSAPLSPVSTTTVSMAGPPPTTVSSAASIPIAKVHPQRQLPTSQPAQPHEITRDTGSVQGGPQGSIFLSQSHRASPNQTTASLTVSTVGPHTDSRQERPAISPHIGPSYLSAEYYNFVNYVPQIMYHPQVAAAHAAQAMAPVPSGTTFRSSHVPSQTPNLAATLQAAAHSMAVSTTQGVRINPMMVTVDPTRHPIPLSVHTAYPQPTTPATEVLASTTADVLTSVVTTSVFSGSGQTVVTSLSQQQHTPQSITGKDPSASPRPSILRKRTNEGTPVAIKKNFSTPTGSERSSPMAEPPLSTTSSPKPTSILDPSRENSQSSTDTATSTENTPSTKSTPEVKIKQEPSDCLENGPANTPTGAVTASTTQTETSPRKKPRKQLLNATVEEIRDGTSTDEEVEIIRKDSPFAKKKEKSNNIQQPVEKMTEIQAVVELSEYVDDEGVRWTLDKVRPNMALMNHYNCTWKARNNHFLRHTDVKVKEDRRPTVNELSNQKGVIQKVSGWRMYHIASQLEEIMDAERDVFSKMTKIQEAIAPKTTSKHIHSMEDDIGMVHELTQGNIQRCQLVIDQLEEAKASMIKILEHKQRITDIINKHHSKRPVKKKERS